MLNQPGRVARSSNKKNARIFFEKNDIPAPTLWLRPQDIPEDAFPVVARTTHHSKGRGFWFCETKAEAIRAAKTQVVKKKRRIRTKKGNLVWRFRETRTEGATHFLKFIPNTREFRVHVVSPGEELGEKNPDDYVVLKVSEKLSDGKKLNSTIKNHDNGWFFGYPKDKNDPALKVVRAVGRDTVAKLGLHWGAVDIMLDKEGNPYVLEVNSTPCLTDDKANTLDKYVRAITGLIGVEEPLRRKRKKEEVHKIKEKKSKKLDKLLSRTRL